MEVTLEASELRRLASLAEMVANPKESIRVLQQARLEARDGTLTLEAASMTWQAHGEADADVQKDGIVGLPLAYFCAVAKHTDGTVSIETADKSATVTMDGPHWTLPVSPEVHNFPLMPAEIGDGYPYLLSADSLRSALDKVSYAMGDHTSPQFAAVHVLGNRIAAGDYFRAQSVLMPDASSDLHMVLPAAVVPGVIRVLRSLDEEVAVRITDTDTYLFAGTTTLKVPRIATPLNDLDALYFAQVQGLAITFTCDRDALTRALKRVQVAAEEKVVTLSVGNSTMRLLAGTGTSTAEAAVSGTSTPALPGAVQSKVNSRHLLDALDRHAADSVTLLLPHTGGRMIALAESDATAVLLQA